MSTSLAILLHISMWIDMLWENDNVLFNFMPKINKRLDKNEKCSVYIKYFDLIYR